MKVAWVIIDRFRKKEGNGRAALRYIERATGLGRPAVIRACRELTEWGFTKRHVGSGTRPSEYEPVWATTKFASGSETYTPASGMEMDTSCGVETITTRPASGVDSHTESYLPSPAYRPADGVGKSVSASGPGADAPAEAGGFERIWRAYGRHGNKQASKRAFEAIASPDVDHIEVRASAWAASAKPGQRRMPLEKWLAAEKYDEADRTVRPTAKPPELDEEGEVARRRDSTFDATEAAERARRIQRSAIEIAVPRRVPLIVVSSALESRDEGTWLEMQTDHGRVAVLLEGRDAATQEAGQAHFGRLTAACGINEIDDSAELHGKPFMVVERYAVDEGVSLPEGTLSAANDNTPQGEHERPEICRIGKYTSAFLPARSMTSASLSRHHSQSAAVGRLSPSMARDQPIHRYD
ncbi:hypothetical protein V5279_24385 [Bradyrhizobium sp. 26S5]|uniref:hypothetical protein n=1 Tax=Bradyrhizobium sp. 26S5 TaxID=3139729 RepID=UPI0030D516DE